MKEQDLPAHKCDLVAAEKIVTMGMPAIEPILGGILEWFQDYNWPVAKVLERVFYGMGVEVVPHIKRVFESDDDVWKYWIIVSVLPKLSTEAQTALREDVLRITEFPTKGEVEEEVVKEAIDYLKKIGTGKE